ncbi:MAG TPA: ribulose-phosphate 3-epimerase, partial [Firmicutes bacterium]|nr:ribulose-phosphate 3-epimerase [Bacillota bacterium]
LVLIMSVNPGFGGQKFIPAIIEKIRDCRAMIGSAPIELQVDGGVSLENVPALIEAGTTNLVAGSAVFGAQNPGEYIDQMRSIGGQG